MKKNGISWVIGAAMLLSMVFQAAATGGELGLWADMFRDDGLPVNGENLSLLVIKNPESVTVQESTWKRPSGKAGWR
jgi:hypothetical protein